MTRLTSLVWAALLPTALLTQDNAAAPWRQNSASSTSAPSSPVVELVKIPNVARDRGNIQRNAEFIAKMMRARGIASAGVG
jgi:hypothetical protein